MAAVRTGADRQIPQLLHSDDTAVGLYLFLHCHLQQPPIGDALYRIQPCQLSGEVIQLIEADIQPCQMGRKCIEPVILVDFQIQRFALLQSHLVHRVPQRPRGSGQVEFCKRLVVRYTFLCQIHAKDILIQGSSLPSAERPAHSWQGLRQEHSSRVCCRIPWQAAAPASRRGAHCCNRPVPGSARDHL